MPKKPKKILIFEGDKINVKNFSKRFGNKGYDLTAISEEINSADFINNVEKIVEKEKPDYVIIGNVRGENIEVAEKIKKIGFDKLVIYASPNIVKKARDKGYTAFVRPKIEQVFEFIEEN